jgi:hypothetical protein
LWLAACSLLSCARPKARPAPRWQPSEFLIGLRCAPPQKPQHYAQAAKAGFNTIVDCVGPDALDLAQRHGLKLTVARFGLDPATLSRAEGRRRVAKVIERFRDAPALWGYFLGDEVTEGQFAGYARVAEFVRERDPAHPFFLNLVSCDAWVGPALASADYAGYVDRFVRAVRPPLLTYSHYPFRATDDARFYFENLELMRRLAAAHDLPFCQTLRGSVWRGMQPLDEGKLRWQVYTSLAYGAKGIVWFSYWGAPEGSREGIVEPDGTPTERYRWIAALNAEVRALGPTLLRLRSVAVYHAGEVPIGTASLPPHGLVGSVEGGAFVVGLFEDEKAEPYVFVANKDYRREAKAKLVINRRCRSVVWLDPAKGDWRDMPARADQFETVLELPLPPGGGKLIRLGL